MVATNRYRLLVISPYYMSFAKGLTDAIASYVKKIDFLIYHNKLLELSRYMPKLKCISKARHYTIDRLIEQGDRPRNLELHILNGAFGLFKRNTQSFANNLSKCILKLIREENIEFDLVHSHFIWPFGYAGTIISKTYDVPLLLTAHGYDIYRLPFLNEKWRYRIVSVLESADHIVTVSDSNARCLQRLGITKQYSVIPNGYDSAIFYPIDKTDCRNLLGIDQEKKVILSVGVLEPVKGHKNLITAIAEISRIRDDILCLIIGRGTLERELRRQISALGLEDVVKLIGWKPHPEIPIWLNACDILALPSLSEGNPSVIFEALACGKPVVATRVGGISEIIIDERYGILCQNNNPNEIKEKLLLSLDKKWDAKEILEYAKQFSYNMIATKYIDLISSMLRKR